MGIRILSLATNAHANSLLGSVLKSGENGPQFDVSNSLDFVLKYAKDLTSAGNDKAEALHGVGASDLFHDVLSKPLGSLLQSTSGDFEDAGTAARSWTDSASGMVQTLGFLGKARQDKVHKNIPVQETLSTLMSLGRPDASLDDDPALDQGGFLQTDSLGTFAYRSPDQEAPGIDLISSDLRDIVVEATNANDSPLGNALSNLLSNSAFLQSTNASIPLASLLPSKSRLSSIGSTLRDREAGISAIVAETLNGVILGKQALEPAIQHWKMKSDSKDSELASEDASEEGDLTNPQRRLQGMDEPAVLRRLISFAGRGAAPAPDPTDPNWIPREPIGLLKILLDLGFPTHLSKIYDLTANAVLSLAELDDFEQVLDFFLDDSNEPNFDDFDEWSAEIRAGINEGVYGDRLDTDVLDVVESVLPPGFLDALEMNLETDLFRLGRENDIIEALDGEDDTFFRDAHLLPDDVQLDTDSLASNVRAELTRRMGIDFVNSSGQFIVANINRWLVDDVATRDYLTRIVRQANPDPLNPIPIQEGIQEVATNIASPTEAIDVPVEKLADSNSDDSSNDPPFLRGRPLADALFLQPLAILGSGIDGQQEGSGFEDDIYGPVDNLLQIDITLPRPFTSLLVVDFPPIERSTDEPFDVESSENPDIFITSSESTEYPVTSDVDGSSTDASRRRLLEVDSLGTEAPVEGDAIPNTYSLNPTLWQDHVAELERDVTNALTVVTASSQTMMQFVDSVYLTRGALVPFLGDEYSDNLLRLVLESVIEFSANLRVIEGDLGAETGALFTVGEDLLDEFREILPTWIMKAMQGPEGLSEVLMNFPQ